MLRWRQYKGGQRWRQLSNGYIEVEGKGIPRSTGNPSTILTLQAEYGETITKAALRWDLPERWIYGMIPIEARRLKANRRRMDPISDRYEPGYTHPEDTPKRVSFGLMQTLLSTAREVADRHRITFAVESEVVPLTVGMLADPWISVLLGGGYMRFQLNRYEGKLDGGAGLDFVYLTGAYNAGSVRYDTEEGNPYHLVTYSDSRTVRAIEWHNDAVFVLGEDEECGCECE